MDSLLAIYSREELLMIAYHWNSPSDPFGTVFASVRGSYYGVIGTPTNFFDSVECAPPIAYSGCVSSALTIPSPVKLSLSGALDITEGFVIVEAEALDPISASDLVINFAVVEDKIDVGGRNLRYVLRWMPDKEPITISSPGDTARAARFFTYAPDWDPSNICVIAFVQSELSKEVYQSKMFCGVPGMIVPPIPLKSKWIGATLPVIDGIFSAGEWDSASETFMDLSYYVNFPFYVYVMNDGTYLYLGIDAVGDLTTPGIHYAGIYFDSNEDGVLTVDEEDALEIISTTVAYKVWDGSAWIPYSTVAPGVPFSGTLRDEAGMVAATGFGPTPREPADHHFYELKIPLALGMLDAVPGDILRPYIYVRSDTEVSYWSPHTDALDPLTYGELTLDTKPVSLIGHSTLWLFIIFIIFTVSIPYRIHT